LQKKNKDVFVIIGPTASSKTAVAIELAKKLNGEIISADSMQIYRGLDVGTAKATKREQKEIQHHLIDICDIKESFSVAEYKDKCYKTINNIISNNKVPIIVGGTGLYINAIINNMQFDLQTSTKSGNCEKNKKTDYNTLKAEELYKKLLKIDKLSAKKIEKNNKKRIVRAINMAHLNVKKSEIEERNDLWRKNYSEFNFFVIYIDIPRDILYDRINKRVELMNKTVLLKEAKKLHVLKTINENKRITALQAIGYKELFGYIEGEVTLEESLEILKQHTRNYAKRQITWFKKIEDKTIVDGTKSKEEIINTIIRGYNEEESNARG